MSLWLAARAYPTLLRAGFAAAVAYRAEFLIWMFTTNMPLVMLAVWSAAARSGPVGGYTQGTFVAYYLATLLIRLVTGSWVVWEMTYEIKQGTLALRLLRPLHPLLAYSAENLAAVPMRGILAIPLVLVLLSFSGRGALTHDWVLWALLPAAIFCAWLITFLVMATIGSLAFFVESAISLFEGWIWLSSLLSGYLVPIDLFPPLLQKIARVLPFRFLLSYPVELMLGKLSRSDALTLLAADLAVVLGALLLTRAVWRAGIRRYSAFGG